jgi:excisionase family DNA binding protein
MSIIEKLEAMPNAITASELAMLLHLGNMVVYDMVSRGALPCIRIGYTVRFDPHEIAQWLRNRSSAIRPNRRVPSTNSKSVSHTMQCGHPNLKP